MKKSTKSKSPQETEKSKKQNSEWRTKKFITELKKDLHGRRIFTLIVFFLGVAFQIYFKDWRFVIFLVVVIIVFYLIHFIFNFFKHYTSLKQSFIKYFICLILFGLIPLYYFLIGISMFKTIEPTMNKPTMDFPNQENKLGNVLIPSNEKFPPNVCRENKDRNLPSNTFFIYLGNSVLYTTIDSFNVVVIDSIPILSIKRNKYGLFLSLTLIDENDIILTEIIDNEIVKNVNNFSRIERDAHTLRLFNSNDEELLFVKFLNPLAFMILGDIYNTSKHQFLVKKNVLTFDGLSFYGVCIGNQSINLSDNSIIIKTEK